MVGQPVELLASRQPSADEMDAYERVLGDAMAGDATLFAREDYVEEAWRIVDPVLKAGTPVHEYEPGPGDRPRSISASRRPAAGTNPVVTSMIQDAYEARWTWIIDDRSRRLRLEGGAARRTPCGGHEVVDFGAPDLSRTTTIRTSSSRWPGRWRREGGPRRGDLRQRRRRLGLCQQGARASAPR